MTKLLLSITLLVMLVSSVSADTETVVYRSGDFVAIRPGTCLVMNVTALSQVIPQGSSTLGELALATLPRFMTLTDYMASATSIEQENISIACGVIPGPDIPKRWMVAVNGIYLDRPAKELVESSTGWERIPAPGIRYPVGNDCDNSTTPVYSAPISGGKQWRFYGTQTKYVVVCEQK